MSARWDLVSSTTSSDYVNQIGDERDSSNNRLYRVSNHLWKGGSSYIAVSHAVWGDYCVVGNTNLKTNVASSPADPVNDEKMVNSGGAMVFKREGNEWKMSQILTPSDRMKATHESMYVYGEWQTGDDGSTNDWQTGTTFSGTGSSRRTGTVYLGISVAIHEKIMVVADTKGASGFHGVSATSNAPTISGVVLCYRLNSNDKWEWFKTLNCQDGNFERTGFGKRTNSQGKADDSLSGNSDNFNGHQKGHMHFGEKLSVNYNWLAVKSSTRIKSGINLYGHSFSSSTSGLAGEVLMYKIIRDSNGIPVDVRHVGEIGRHGNVYDKANTTSSKLYRIKQTPEPSDDSHFIDANTYISTTKYDSTNESDSSDTKTVDRSLWIYTLNNFNQWVPTKVIKIDNPPQEGNAYQQVAGDGDFIAVRRGAMELDNDNKKIKWDINIYWREWDDTNDTSGNNNTWGHYKTITYNNSNEDETYGQTWGTGPFKLSNNYLIVNTNYHDDENNDIKNSGVLYVFGRDEGGNDNWGLVQKILPENPVKNLYYGRNSFIYENYITILETNDTTKASQLHQYKLINDDNISEVEYAIDKGVRSLQKKTSETDDFGQGIHRAGDWVAIGKKGAYKQTHYDIYKLDENNLLSSTKSKTIQPSTSQYCGLAGRGFAMDENTAVLSLDKQDNKEVGVEIFEKDQDGVDKWGDVKVVRPSDKDNFTNSKRFGRVISVDGDYIVVGDYDKSIDNDDTDDAKAYKEGSVYILKKNYPTASEKWGELKMIHEPGTYKFGISAVLKDDYLCVGCVSDDLDDANSESYRIPSIYIYKKDKDGVDNWGYVTKVYATDVIQLAESKSSSHSSKNADELELKLKFDGTTLCNLNRLDHSNSYMSIFTRNNDSFELSYHKKFGSYNNIYPPQELGHNDSNSKEIFANSGKFTRLTNANNHLPKETIHILNNKIYLQLDGAFGKLYTDSKLTFYDILCFKNTPDSNNNPVWDVFDLYSPDIKQLNQNSHNANFVVVPTDEEDIIIQGYKNGKYVTVSQIYNTFPLSKEETIAAATNLLISILGFDNTKVNNVKAVAVESDASNKTTIPTNVKESIIQTSGGGSEDVKKIRKKRENILKILFAQSNTKKIKVTPADLGIDKTLEESFSGKTLKANVLVVKKNSRIPIKVSDEITADTAVYTDLSELNDKVKFDMGNNITIEIKKTQNEDDSGKKDQWTVIYNGTESVKEAGDKVTANGKTIYIGSTYMDGSNEGLPADDSDDIYSTNSLKIPYVGTTSTFESDANILKNRHTELKKLWDSTLGSSNFVTKSSDLGLDRTAKGATVKENVRVFKANGTMDLSSASTLITSTRGAYADLSGVDDYIKITGVTNDSNDDFTICVTQAEPKKYQLKDATRSNALFDILYEDGDKVTYKGKTFYLGGVYTSGTNDGIDASNPISLSSLKIAYVGDSATFDSDTNINKNRHDELNKLWNSNPGVTNLKTKSTDIGLNRTVKGIIPKENVKVLQASNATNDRDSVDMTADITSDTGVYVDLSGIGDFVKITGLTGGTFRVQVTSLSPKTYKIKNEAGNSDLMNNDLNDGDKITFREKTFYFGGLYTSGTNEGIPTDGTPMDLESVKIPFQASGTVGVDPTSQITTFSSNSKIREDRHAAIASVFSSNDASITSFVTYSAHLGLDRTVGKPVKSLVKVFKKDQEVNISSNTNKNQGFYADLSGVGDYVKITGGSEDFRIKVDSINPKKYIIQNAGGTAALSTVKFLDGQWVTHGGVTLYFGGVFSNGTNDGITAADPYVFPINGNPYKLPDRNANYCLYADENTFITGMVRQLPLVEQKKMREWVIEKLGSDTNNGAELVTDGFFYSAVHVNTNIGELYLDLETKVCNTTNKGMFNVSFKNTRDNTELFKGEHKTTATISWKDNGNTIAVDVDFFENPQIRNGIRMNTVITKSNPIGLLIEDYEPSLLRVKNPKNKLNKYERLVNKLELGHRVAGEKLNLQKEGELWTRHKM